MSDYTRVCHRCGWFLQTHNGEYPSLCKKCSEYMVESKKKRLEQLKVARND